VEITALGLKLSNSTRTNFGYLNISDNNGNLFWFNLCNNSNYQLTNA
jgi:hypothetical protein